MDIGFTWWFHWALPYLVAPALACWLVELFFVIKWYARLGKHVPNAQPVSAPPISVIVCVHNNLADAKSLLEALQLQQYPNYEVIVVDDRSDDETYDYLLSLRDVYENFKLTRINERPNHTNAKKFALTMGIKAATHEHVLLTDADCLPDSPLWIAHMAAGFTTGKEIVLGYSPYRKSKGLLNTLIIYETQRTAMQYLGAALAGQPYMGVGRNLAYTKTLFFAYKGFYKHVSVNGGDDDLFINRTATHHNVAVQVHPATFTTSIPKDSFGDWYRQKQRHYHVGKLYKPEHKRRLGLLNSAYFCFYIALIPPLFLPFGWAFSAGLWALRSIIVSAVVHGASKRLGQPQHPLAIPFIDAVYVWVFTWFSVRALLRKRYNRW